MTATYEAIATTTLGTATNSLFINSIPATYTDLVLIANPTGFSAGTSSLAFQFNGDSASNYSGTGVVGTGSAATSNRYTSLDGAIVGGYNNGSGTGMSTLICNIQNYANTTTFKTIVSRYSAAGLQADASVALWRKTPEAINSIKVYIYGNTNTFNVGSTFTLYGIKAE
jgi:hypothetical protein